MSELKQGHIYRIVPHSESCSLCGQELKTEITRFPFDEPYGIYCGVANKNGFLVFRFSGGKEGIVNGGFYEEVKANIIITPGAKNE